MLNSGLAIAMALAFNMFVYQWLVFVPSDTVPTLEVWREELLLWAALGGIATAWVTVRALGRVADVTAVGFFVALVGLTARMLAIFTCSGIGVFPLEPATAQIVEVLGPIAALSTLGLLAYGLGLGLVVFSSAADMLRRRRDPAWTRSAA